MPSEMLRLDDIKDHRLVAQYSRNYQRYSQRYIPFRFDIRGSLG
jgi:hypothetical protein